MCSSWVCLAGRKLQGWAAAGEAVFHQAAFNTVQHCTLLFSVPAGVYFYLCCGLSGREHWLLAWALTSLQFSSYFLGYEESGQGKNKFIWFWLNQLKSQQEFWLGFCCWGCLFGFVWLVVVFFFKEAQREKKIHICSRNMKSLVLLVGCWRYEFAAFSVLTWRGRNTESLMRQPSS